VKHRQALIPQLQAVFATKTRAQWIEMLSAAGVTVAPVNSVREALDDVQVRARGMVAQVQHPGLGRSIAMTAPPVKYSATPARIRRAPPLLGQHTDEVLTSVLGYSPDDVKAMREGTRAFTA
jgi:crotonobetainyl-CoA:carnitine CoA-transferase CaiB-like acyl-CoA transferase